MIAQFGDCNKKVAEIQKYLSLSGYDLITDGKFGKITLRSLKAFQKKVGLESNGIVDDLTMVALKAALKRTSKEDKSDPIPNDYSDIEIKTTHPLPPEQYIKQFTEKKQIFLHFTAGWPSAENTISYWKSDEPRVATAFVIDGSTGEIYECFHPDYWAYHLGVKGTNGKLDKISIGIEICNFGPLKESNGEFFAWPNDWKTKISAENVYELDTPFKGFKHYYKYTDKQLESLEKLIAFLVKKYNIPVQESFDMSWYDYKPDLIKNASPGIWTHVNVRKDKFDLAPHSKVLEILNKISNLVKK